MKLTESEVKQVIYETVKKLLKESTVNEMNWFHREYPEGKPQKASEVIRGNGWDGKVISKKPGEIVLSVRQDYDAVFPDFSESLPFEQLIEDLNIFYEDNGKPFKAESIEEYNGKGGYLIRVSRK